MATNPELERAKTGAGVPTGATGANGEPPAQAAAESSPRRGVVGRVIATTRELVSFCVEHPLWSVCMLVFVSVWTAELFIVQELTLLYPNETSASFAFWAPKIRLTLDALFIVGLTFWLRRRWLLFAVVGAFFVNLALMTYTSYFQRPLTLLTIMGNWHEGLEVSGTGVALFPKGAAFALLAAMVVKLAALFISRGASLPRRCAWLAGSVPMAAYACLYAIAIVLDPLDAIQTTRGVGRLGEIRGYLGPWFAEWYYLGDSKVLESALEYRKRVYDRLTPVEADIPIHKRLVILQAESLDFNILGYTVNGQEVTPFLNRLRDMSMFYRVVAMHFNGSADADFVALNGVSGSRHANTYIIPDYPYENTTPQLLARCGFKVSSFHGNGGEFYSRRAAFEKIGFERVYFREELEGKHGLRGEYWGVADRDVLSFSAQMLRTATEPTCHFIITLTTHTPYTLLPPGEREIFPNPRTTVEHYINNMRYLDNCLRDYVTSLGSGTTVMIYADHPTEQGDATFRPDRAGEGIEYIPCFIYDSDQDLSQLQKTRDNPLARDGSLNLVDVVNYLRGQIERSYGPASPAGQPPVEDQTAEAEPTAKTAAPAEPAPQE